MPRDREWRPVLDADELWVGEMLGVQVGDVGVVLVNVEEGLRAYLDRCPHRSSKLSEGALEGERLTCGTHLWEFHAGSGRGINPDRAELEAVPVRVVDGVIEVQVPDGAAGPVSPNEDANSEQEG